MNAFVDAFGWLLDGENWSGGQGLGTRLVEHIGISALTLLVATLAAVPLGLWLGHLGRGQVVAINLGNVGRAVPTLAVLVLFAFLPAPLGANTFSFVLALSLFALPPLLTNTYVGVREVDRDVVDAARGLGMSGWEVLTKVELPLAAPLVFTGLRLAGVQIVATATVIGLVSGGALGRTISSGFTRGDQPQVIGGAILVTLLALLTEYLLGRLERLAQRRSSGSQAQQAPAGMPGAQTAAA